MWATLAVLCCIAAMPSLGGKVPNRITLDFFREEYSLHENQALVPLGIYSILTMLFRVAKPGAAQFMQDRLFLPGTASDATEKIRHLLGGINQHRNTLEMLTRVYLTDAPLDPDFIPHLRVGYNFSSEILNLDEEQTVAERVNTWVNETTRGMIPECVTGRDVYSLKSSLYVNVMFLNTSWEMFDAKNTKKQTFHFVNGNHEVDMMQAEKSLPHMYLSDLQVLVIKLPYQEGTDLSMLIVLPAYHTCLTDVVQRFTIDHYQQFAELDIEDECYERLQLSMPTFTIQQKLDARATRSQMQVGPLFSHPSFKILEKELSQLGRIKQATFVKVNDYGTEAVAETGSSSTETPTSIPIAVDRPFLFLIRKESTKDILIIGHYSQFEKGKV